MCVTSGKAHLSKTHIYAGEFFREGALVHALMYQNTPVNQGAGGNCMLLHIPASEPLTEANVVSVEGGSHFIEKVTEETWAAYRRSQPRSRGGVVAAGRTDKKEEKAIVFEQDIYTVVIASRPVLVPAALKRVPENRRPKVKASLLTFYHRTFPGWPLVLCCFDSNDATPAKPLLWWYKPKYPNLLFAPGVDAHDGNPPDLEKGVPTDHMVVMGTVRELKPTRHRLAGPADEGYHARMSAFEPALATLWPRHASAERYMGTETPNADFVMDIRHMEGGARAQIERKIIG